MAKKSMPDFLTSLDKKQKPIIKKKSKKKVKKVVKTNGKGC